MPDATWGFVKPTDNRQGNRTIVETRIASRARADAPTMTTTPLDVRDSMLRLCPSLLQAFRLCRRDVLTGKPSPRQRGPSPAHLHLANASGSLGIGLLLHRGRMVGPECASAGSGWNDHIARHAESTHADFSHQAAHRNMCAKSRAQTASSGAIIAAVLMVPTFRTTKPRAHQRHHAAAQLINSALPPPPRDADYPAAAAWHTLQMWRRFSLCCGSPVFSTTIRSPGRGSVVMSTGRRRRAPGTALGLPLPGGRCSSCLHGWMFFSSPGTAAVLSLPDHNVLRGCVLEQPSPRRALKFSAGRALHGRPEHRDLPREPVPGDDAPVSAAPTHGALGVRWQIHSPSRYWCALGTPWPTTTTTASRYPREWSNYLFRRNVISRPATRVAPTPYREVGGLSPPINLVLTPSRAADADDSIQTASADRATP